TNCLNKKKVLSFVFHGSAAELFPAVFIMVSMTDIPSCKSAEFGKRKKVTYEPQAVFRVFSPEVDMEDTCTVKLFQQQTLQSCGFNSSHPLVIITHGWSMDGLIENWVTKLATALKSSQKDINVLYTDWRTLAHQHYPIAAQNTRIVGRDLAMLLMWLEVKAFKFSVHLIGYSLGAHISGFAGSNLAMSGKTLGRITGLDPAGPLFEGMSASDRLSPDDARFVDAIHTFTQQHMGLSVGIKQPVAHFDFYPNGGSSQPGCQLHVKNLYAHLSQYGLMGKQEGEGEGGVKSLNCSYKVGRFTLNDNSLIILLPVLLYTVYHFQFRIQLFTQIERIDPSLSITLTGTQGESETLPIVLEEEISGNRSYSFLITQDRDIGDLMMLYISWEDVPLWANMWSRMKTIMPWRNKDNEPQLTVGRIRVKAGETQQKTGFCAQSEDSASIHPAEQKLFVRCDENPLGEKKK
uniref:triacylglycerol lipase n=1 Tax=Astyanax mexicanus TaxID=7994 RepID=W5KYJ0_ASTMX